MKSVKKFRVIATLKSKLFLQGPQRNGPSIEIKVLNRSENKPFSRFLLITVEFTLSFVYFCFVFCFFPSVISLQHKITIFFHYLLSDNLLLLFQLQRNSKIDFKLGFVKLLINVKEKNQFYGNCAKFHVFSSRSNFITCFCAWNAL